MTGRAYTDIAFENPVFSFQITGGAVSPIRDLALTFAVENNFSTTAVTLGPTPMDAEIGEVGSIRYLLFSDAGANTVFVFDADTLLPIVTLF